MDSRTTSFAKEVSVDGEKTNSLDRREGITQEFNNNLVPFSPANRGDGRVQAFGIDGYQRAGPFDEVVDNNRAAFTSV
jgi:hypothetical protein